MNPTGPMLSAEKPAIVVDLDGCALDFTGGYMQFARDQGHEKVNIADMQSYYFMHEDFGLDPEKSRWLFDHFTNAEGFKNLSAYPGTRDLFHFLGKHFQVIISTDVPTRAQQDRLDNLSTLGIKYDAIEFGPAKAEVANKYNALYVIEDTPKHIESIVRNTRATVLMPYWCYNTSMREYFPRVHELGEVGVFSVNVLKVLRSSLRVLERSSHGRTN